MKGLAINGVDVVECNVNWRDKNRYFKLFKQLRALKNEYDFIYVAYPATIPVIFAKLFQKKIVVMDAFYSMFDAVVNDRKEVSFLSFRSIKLLFLDWVSIMLAGCVITDTEAHKKYWQKWFFVRQNKFFTLYLGADNTVFFPIKDVSFDPQFRVHFHGSYIPLQGIEHIVEAARILKDDTSVFFSLVGKGQNYKEITERIQSYDLKNIEQVGKTFPGPLQCQLNEYVNKADVALGIFGDSDKAKRVIPNKVYESLAAGKPLITMDSPAIREIFSERELLLVKNDGESIASAIKKLQNSPEFCREIASRGYAKMIEKYSPKPIGARFLEIAKEFKER